MKAFFETVAGKRFSVLLVCLLTVSASCNENFLEVPPQGEEPSEQFWVSADDAAKAVNAMYANLRGWTQVAFAPIAIESLGSDDTEMVSSPTDAVFIYRFDNFTV